MHVMKRRRLERNLGFAHDCVFGISAIARRVGQTVNFVALLKSGHTRADLFHNTRQVPPRNKREFVWQEVLQVTFTNFPIGRVHPGRVNSDENVGRRGDFWTRRLFILQDFRPAVLVDSNSFHRT